MATVGDITVRIKVQADEFIYSLETAKASFTRLDRRIWMTLPRWKRIWMTYRRQGW